MVLVIARDEGDRIAQTVQALREAFGDARVIVADGGSSDDTATEAARAGAELVRCGTQGGKGGSATLAARRALSEDGSEERMFLLCDGDLGRSAGHLGPLVAAVEAGSSISRWPRSRRDAAAGSGSRWGSRAGRSARGRGSSCGRRSRASARCAARPCARVLPFAHGFGMETAMTIDAARAGLAVGEVELELEHRATGRNLAGFLHRGRQLLSFLRVYVSRR